MKITIIRYFILFFAFFSKTVGLSSVFNAEMNSTCQNTLITAFLWNMEKKADFLQIFALTIVWWCGGYGPKNWSIPFWPNLTSFHLKTMIPLFLCNSASNFLRKSQKIENNDNLIFYFIFCIFLKNRRVESVFNAEMNSTCQNTLITAFLWNMEKKADFLQIFALTIVWRCGGYGPKNWSIPFWLNLTSFHLKTMIPLFLCNSASNF